MGKETGILWTDSTLNFWWGCHKVSPGCTNCYAETFSKRVGRDIWGPAQTTERWRTKAPWRDCLKWDKEAKSEGKRRKVFVQSMSDFFEDHPQVESWREKAIKILEGFEWLDIQLLTKRPENILKMVPTSWHQNWPGHIWIGTTAENQEYADKRIPYLLRVPARVRFLSVEPMLEPIDLTAMPYRDSRGSNIYLNVLSGRYDVIPTNHGAYFWKGEDSIGHIHWVITGGESGHNARPCHPEWVRSLRDQCQTANVAFFHKQWGEWLPTDVRCSEDYPPNMATAPHTVLEEYSFSKVGKAAAGRLLDGMEWSQFPEVG